MALGSFPLVQAQTASSEIEKVASPIKEKVNTEEILLKKNGTEDDEEVLFVQDDANEVRPLENFSIALQAKSYDKIDQYLKNGSNINQQLYDGNTAIHISAFQTDTKFLNFISERKAALTTLNKNNESILYWASAGKSIEYLDTAKTLLGKDFDSLLAKKTKRDRTPLHSAVLYSGNLNVVNWLISNRVDINAKDENGQTALHYAVVTRNWDVLELLLQKGGKLSEKDNEGRSVEDYVFEKMDILNIDKLYPFVSAENKKFIEESLSSVMPLTLMKLNPSAKYDVKLTAGLDEKEELVSGSLTVQ